MHQRTRFVLSVSAAVVAMVAACAPAPGGSPPADAGVAVPGPGIDAGGPDGPAAGGGDASPAADGGHTDAAASEAAATDAAPSDPPDPVCVPVTIQNPSFEMPRIQPPWQRITSTEAGGELPGWVGAVDVHDASDLDVPAGGGSQLVDLNQDDAGSIEQTLTLVPGAAYELSFWHGVNYHCTAGATFAVRIGGVEHVYSSQRALAQEHLTFAAKEADTKLVFQSLSPGCGATTIDLVDLTCSSAPRVWPNADSKANSDPWLLEHHEAITWMEPRILGLNFVAAATEADVRARFAGVIDRLAEGSRYHGYGDRAARPFLRYQIEKIVTPGPAPSRNPGNELDYGALFSDDFAKKIGIVDGAGNPMNLCQLLEAGRVHEVWMYFDSTFPKGLEVVEMKPRYDAGGNLEPSATMICTGNGCMSAADANAAAACKRSVKIAAYDSTRTPTELVHSLGHGMEGLAKAGAIPPFTDGFRHFANLDLDTRLGASFNDYYGVCGGFDVPSYQAKVLDAGATCPPDSTLTDGTGRPVCLRFEGTDRVAWRGATASGAFDPYGQGCGNVHFAANGRAHYDFVNDCAVQTTCEHYGLRDDAGKDQATTYPPTAAYFADYRARYDDEGAWQTYWRQNMIGKGVIATAPNGRLMANWWPYLFY